MVGTPRVFTPAKAGAGGLIAGLGIASTLLAGFEGDRTHAYLDSARIATICRGVITYSDGTRVRMGDVRTENQCLDLNNVTVKKIVKEMQVCLNVPVTPMTAGAMISFGYNVGSGAFCRSVAQDFNSGLQVNGCKRMNLYVYAAHKVINGLVTRRNGESTTCLSGLT